MNICEPEVVFLTVANGDEAAFNKSDKALQRSLMSAGARFEATWACRQGGFHKWLAVKADTDSIRWTVDAATADPSVSVSTKEGFLDGGRQSREGPTGCPECSREDPK